jgi:hypothetical protein
LKEKKNRNCDSSRVAEELAKIHNQTQNADVNEHRIRTEARNIASSVTEKDTRMKTANILSTRRTNRTLVTRTGRIVKSEVSAKKKCTVGMRSRKRTTRIVVPTRLDPSKKLLV